MKEAPTNSGKTYSVHTANGCTVSDDSGWSKTIDAPDGYFTAHGSTVYLSDDEATMREVFKLAPQQKLALLGVLGGNDGLPAGYKRVEYIESTGTQYINSEVNPGTHVYIDIVYELTDNVSGYWVILGKNQNVEVGVSRCNIAYTGGTYAQAEFGWWAYVAIYRQPYTKLHIIFESEIGDVHGAKATVNGEECQQKGLSDIYYRGDVSTLVDPMWFFARNTSNVPYAYSRCRLYYCQVKTKTAKATFIPALDNLGTPGLYCPETKTFLTNLGTGDFLYPGKETEVSTFSLRRPVTYAQLTAHGVRRLYKVPAGYNGTKDEYALANGFKPIVETEQPEEGYWTPRWTETEEEIVLEWVETEPPMDELGMPAEPLTNN